MKLRQEAIEITDAINPKGPMVKGMVKTVERAMALEVLCGVWLSAQADDVDKARQNQPVPGCLPAAHPGRADFEAAVKTTGAWDRPSRPSVWPTVSVTETGKIRKVMRGTANPMFSQRWDWAWVFDHWYSGALRRSIDDLLALIPEDVRPQVGEL